MNVNLRTKLIAQASAVLLLPAIIFVPPASAEPIIDDGRIVGNQTRSGFAEVINKTPYAFRDAIFYPTDGGTSHLSSGFGQRPKACVLCSTYHLGADFTAGYGGDVRAVTDGIVESVGFDGRSGFKIVIRHPLAGDVKTFYAHLIKNSNLVSVGDTVTANQKIASIGQTGVATAPHLHLEIWVNGNPVDPVKWLKKRSAIKN
jgi:murein DD-endopeptidase MepM/ murein hydrolase activator NlpD